MTSKSRARQHMPTKSGEIKPTEATGNWFRVYSGILQSQRWQALEGDQFKFLINVMALASEARGVLPDIATICFRLRLDEAHASGFLSALLGHGFVELADTEASQVVRVRNWQMHQYVERSSTVRMRKLRAKNKPKNDDVTSHVTLGDATVTSHVTDVPSSPSTSSHVSREEGSIQENNLATRIVLNPGHSLADPSGHKAIEGTYGGGVTPAKVVMLASRRVS